MFDSLIVHIIRFSFHFHMLISVHCIEIIAVLMHVMLQFLIFFIQNNNNACNVINIIGTA